eukprot:GILI01004995.1.p1 GENE.GILI01004995.1~~GILI01004995.1.p1  ORF type:complete len:548 (-),score=87.63 GILI01004995.1:402-2045(-)
MNTPPPLADISMEGSPKSNSQTAPLRLPAYFEKKGYRAIRVIGEGNYGKALLVSTALGKSTSGGIHMSHSDKDMHPITGKKRVTIDPLSKTHPLPASEAPEIPPLVVIKHVNMSQFTKAERAAAKNEVGVLKRLDHPNIIKYYDSVEVDVDHLYICIEYADGGDLSQLIKKSKTSLPEADVVSLFKQLVSAVGYMHSQKVLHRDLKPQNVFLSQDGTQVKVGDFGFSKALSYTFAMANTLCGTPYFYSPELCKGKPYNAASDVWALGIMLYEMVSRKMPFDARTIPQLAAAICTKEPARPKELGTEKGDALWQLLCDLLCKNPLGRPDCAFILRNAALKTPLSSENGSPSNSFKSLAHRSASPDYVEANAEAPPVARLPATPQPPTTRSPSTLPPSDNVHPALVQVQKSIPTLRQVSSPSPARPQTPSINDTYRTLKHLNTKQPDLPRPMSRHQHPSMLPPRRPESQVEAESKGAPQARRAPSVQTLKVAQNNSHVGNTIMAPPPQRRERTAQFDSLNPKGLPMLHYGQRVPTPLSYSTLNAKFNVA